MNHQPLLLHTSKMPALLTKLYKLLRPLRRILQILFTGIDSLFNYPFDTAILTYHSISTDALSDLELQISLNEFLWQVNYLKSNYIFLDIESASARIKNKKKGRVKYISLMFDDGYHDFLENVLPIAEENNIPVSIAPALKYLTDNKYAPVNSLVNTKYLPSSISLVDLQKLACHPLVTIVSHGYAHIDYSSLSSYQINHDLQISTSIFESLNCSPYSFCYPMGKFSNFSNQKLRDHFDYLYIGPLLYFFSLPSYLIPRIPVLKSDSRLSFKSRVSGKLFRDTLIIPMLAKALKR